MHEQLSCHDIIPLNLVRQYCAHQWLCSALKLYLVVPVFFERCVAVHQRYFVWPFCWLISEWGQPALFRSIEKFFRSVFQVLGSKLRVRLWQAYEGGWENNWQYLIFAPRRIFPKIFVRQALFTGPIPRISIVGYPRTRTTLPAWMSLSRDWDYGYR